jgi:hypothetical protein
MKKILFSVIVIMIFGCITAQVKYDKTGILGAKGNPEWMLIETDEKLGFLDIENTYIEL